MSFVPRDFKRVIAEPTALFQGLLVGSRPSSLQNAIKPWTDVVMRLYRNSSGITIAKYGRFYH